MSLLAVDLGLARMMIVVHAVERLRLKVRLDAEACMIAAADAASALAWAIFA